MSTTAHILEQVRALGWKVSVHHEPNAVSIECEDLRRKRGLHYARVTGALSDVEAEYKAAVEIAASVGIDVEE